MKYTPDATGAQQAGQGIGSMFKALVLGPQMRQKAEMEAMGSMAKIGHYQAAARKYNADADLDENKLRLQQDSLQSAMLQHGLPTNLAPAFKKRLETGGFGGGYETPEVDGVGPVMPAPADNDAVARLGRTIALMQRVHATGSNVEQGAKAGAVEQQQRNIAAIQANPSWAGATGQAYAAVEGKPLFDNVGDTGASINKFTGAQEIVNNVLGNRHGAESGAKVGQARAAAANSYAAAGQHSAQTQKIRQDIEMGGKGIIQQTDQGLLLVDPRTGAARPIVGPDGRTAGKAVGGEEKPLTEGQAKAVAFASRMQASDNIIADLAASGTIKSVPGSRAGYGVGATINAISPSGSQRLDQAKRDFINAVLRRESGAVISDGEFSNAELQYFPQIGEGKAQQQQKANNRRIALEGMKADIPKGRLQQVERISSIGANEPAASAKSSGATGRWGETNATAAPSPIKSDDDYNALPSGAVFIAPDGSQRRKP